MRCVIVDDEPLARANLEALLADHGDAELVASHGRAQPALEAVIDDPPDLLLLDVRMPGLDGLAFMRCLRAGLSAARRPYVVLVTAFDRFALAAFDYEALDYLLKPVEEARFADTLRRARERLARRAASSAAARVENGPTAPSAPRSRADSPSAAAHHRRRTVTLPTGSGELFLDPASICWVEAADHYLLVHTPSRTHLVRGGLSALEEQVDSPSFLRVHRSAVVNVAHVVEHRVGDGGTHELRMTDGSRVAVSRRRWSDVRRSLRRRD